MDGGLAVDGSQPGIYIFVCSYAMCILFGRKGSHEVGIGRGMEGDHDILVATPCPGGEATCVIREQACEWELEDGDTVGSEGIGSGGLRKAVWLSGCIGSGGLR